MIGDKSRKSQERSLLLQGCAGYVVHPLTENDEFFGRMYDVASTADGRIYLNKSGHMLYCWQNVAGDNSPCQT